MNVTAKHYRKILKIIERLYEHSDEREMRADVAESLLDLLDADYFASFRWDPAAKSYGQGVYLNMDTSNIGKYCEYYQYHDPITLKLAQRKQTTVVSEIMPHERLRQTEFFNDFLAADGLHYGVNLHLYNFDDNIGDLRVWRKRGRGDFDKSACTLLDLLKPHFIHSLETIRLNASPVQQKKELTIDSSCSLLKRQYCLTERELQVARLMMRGERDFIIADKLHIGVTTVRTHIKNIFKKTGINSRNQLHAQLAS